jgi:bifunctional DNA-binding transcriptional regulator/antitoxin component of YhaV-PrlF toxin-antitoxin module
MPTYDAVVGPNGTVTLPTELCSRLKIKEGTPVEFFLTLDGQVHFHAITGTATGFAGLLSTKRTPPISIREMDDAIADHLAEKDERIKRQARQSSKRRPARRPAAE